jgi:CheY-like chemotaxis protein
VRPIPSLAKRRGAVETVPQVHRREVVMAISSDSIFYPFVEEGGALKFSFSRFRTGEEALKSLTAPESLVPDLIIASYDLPIMNGSSFVARCHQLPKLSIIPALILIPRGFDRAKIKRRDTSVPVALIEIPDNRAEWSERVKNIIGYWSIVVPTNEDR